MRRREFIAGLGSAAAWPMAAARAQKPALPVVGFLDLGSPRPNASYVVAFRQGLAAAGFVEGRTVAIEYRWANNEGARLDSDCTGCGIEPRKIRYRRGYVAFDPGRASAPRITVPHMLLSRRVPGARCEGAQSDGSFRGSAPGIAPRCLSLVGRVEFSVPEMGRPNRARRKKTRRVSVLIAPRSWARRRRRSLIF
jgi:putative ABC transport system substrate-binding protein